MKAINIGIIGYGVVGKAVENTLSKKFNIKKFDIAKKYDTFSEISSCDFVFICVPTPFDNETEEVDISAVSTSLQNLSENNCDGIVIIKSTLPPGSTDRLSKDLELKICFNPEFLRESISPNEDFENQEIVVIGTDSSDIFQKVKKMYNNVLQQDATFFHSTFTEAEMIKYAQNTTLASRVAIANIIFDACKHLNIDYNFIKSIAFDSFDILGPYMVEVPGPDGKRGFGGKCLPKDISGFNSTFESDVLSKIIEYNKGLRDDLD